MKSNNQNDRPNRSLTEQENAGPAAHREQQQNSNHESHNAQSNVTPPEKREFPTEGPSKANFEQRPHGRTTGRMTDAEPGTV